MKLFICLFYLLLITSFGNAQDFTLSQEQESQIAEIFQPWESEENPGLAVMILSEGVPIFNQGFGLANVDKQIKINDHTQFDIGPMSSHFTAYAVLQLVNKNVLSPNDDIRTYLPELNYLNEKITIAHLISHSSGLPGYWPLRDLSGYTDENTFTEDDALRLYSRNWQLANKPGSKHVYKGTASSLLAKIVSRATSKSFGTYMEESVFGPLGMTDTYINGHEKTNPEQLAVPYQETEDGFIKVENRMLDTGGTGVISTSADLSKWYKQLAEGNNDIPLDHRIGLEDGTEASSSFGHLTNGQQFWHMERGIPKIWDSGTVSGYAASTFRFPDQGLVFIVLGNNGMRYNGWMGMTAANLLLADYFDEDVSETKEYKEIELTQSQMEKYTGSYYDLKDHILRKIGMINDTLHYIRPNYGNNTPLYGIANGALKMKIPNQDVRLELVGQQLSVITEDATYQYEKFDPPSYSEREMKSYTGFYFSKELMKVIECKYEDGKLSIWNDKGPLSPLNAYTKDKFVAERSYLKLMNFQRNAQNEVIGFAQVQEELNIQWIKI